MKDGGPAVRPFPFKDVAILVVDECSLVAVSNLSFLLYILTKHAKLKRIIFLGDIQQLPSIEAGMYVEVFCVLFWIIFISLILLCQDSML